MKTILSTTALTCLISLSTAQAAITTLDLELSRDSAQSSTSEGTIAVTISNTGPTGGADQFMTYTISGLSLDSVGSADDSVTLTMPHHPQGQLTESDQPTMLGGLMMELIVEALSIQTKPSALTSMVQLSTSEPALPRPPALVSSASLVSNC